MRKFIAIFLSFVLLFSSLGIDVLAIDIGNNTNSAKNLLSDEILDDKVLSQKKEQEYLDGLAADDNAKLTYIVLTKPEVKFDESNSGKQDVLVGIGDGSLAVESARLGYIKEDSTEYIEADARTISSDGSIVFELNFQSKDKGTYAVEYIEYRVNDKTYCLKLSDAGMNRVLFGVGVTVDTEPDAYALDKENESLLKSAKDNDIKMLIAESDGKGGFKEGEDISLAADKSSSFLSSSKLLKSKLKAGKDVVVMLDPGHGGGDPGTASYNGTAERDINLKIAKYCKSELETYSGIKVHLTRDNNSSKPGLTERAQMAKNVGADLLVSLHCNSSASSSVNGAEIYYPNSASYNKNTHDNGKKVAQEILSQLAALGITGRGIYTRNSDIGERYSTGEIQDYYTIISAARERNIAAIIVEHAYMSNRSDFDKYLSSDAKLKNLGVADAKGIAKHFNLSKKNTNNYSTEIPNGKYVIASVSNLNKVLDIPGASKNAGEKVQLYSENHTAAQIFNVTRSGKYYTFENTNSSERVQAFYDTITQENKNNAVKQQSWGLKKASDSTFYLENIGDKDKYITANTSNNSLSSSNYKGSKAQQFVFIPVGSKALANGEYIIGSRLDTNKVLDIAGGSKSNSANCQIYSENRTNAQIYQLSYKDGYYTVKNKNSGKVLDAASGGLSNGTNVQQYSSNGTVAQKWALKGNANSGYSLVNRANGLYLDVAGGSRNNSTNVALYQGNNTKAQKFLFLKSTTTQPVENGTYSINSKYTYKGNTLVLDVKGGSTADRTDIHLYSYNGTSAQKFKIQKIDKYYYKIIAQNSGKALDVDTDVLSNDLNNDGFQNGANLQQFTYNGGASQKWIIEKNNDGSYTFIARSNGKCINVSGGSQLAKDDADIQMYQKDGTDACKFKLTKIETEKIMGNSKVSVDKMVKFYEQTKGSGAYSQYLNSLGSNKSEAPSTLKAFCQMYLDEGKKEGVRGDIAFCQAMLETGWLGYSGSSVESTQFNFAGIGATDVNPKPATFSSAQIGIRAQIQHLKAYASKDKLNQKCVDPRFHLVTRGSAPNVEDLAGKWATDPEYGNKILNILTKLMNA